jgi:hypothetical protein
MTVFTQRRICAPFAAIAARTSRSRILVFAFSKHPLCWPALQRVGLSLLAGASLDHLVGASEQRRWHFQTYRLGGRQVDDEVEHGRLLNRELFVGTVTIIPFMPNGWDPAAGFPAMAGNVPFLVKDIVLLAVSFYLLKQDVMRVSLSARDAGDGRRSAPVAAAGAPPTTPKR